MFIVVIVPETQKSFHMLKLSLPNYILMTLTYCGVYEKCRDFSSNVNYHYGNVDTTARAQKVRARYNTFLLCGVFCIPVSVRHKRTFPVLFHPFR